MTEKQTENSERAAVPLDAENQWFGDMMILQMLADSDNVNEQEREVLQRWILASERPSQGGADLAALLWQAREALKEWRDQNCNNADADLIGAIDEALKDQVMPPVENNAPDTIIAGKEPS
jgi:hypothetical protein